MKFNRFATHLKPDFDLRIFQAKPCGEFLSIGLRDVLLEFELSLEAFSLEIAEHSSTPRSLSLYI